MGTFYTEGSPSRFVIRLDSNLRRGRSSALSQIVLGRRLAANWLAAQHVVFAVGLCTKLARHGSVNKKAGKPETSVPSVLDSVLSGFTPMEFSHCALER